MAKPAQQYGAKPFAKKILWRNYLNPDFCPVVVLQQWLGAAGIKQGPIFLHLGESGEPLIAHEQVTRVNGDMGLGTRSKVWVDVNGKTVNLSPNMVGSDLKIVF